MPARSPTLRYFSTALAFVLSLLCHAESAAYAAIPPGLIDPPHRLIVLSDIEADPDDTESFVRLMLYSDVIDIEGMIATTSCWKRSSVAPESIRAIVQAYAKVHPNLLKHDPNYPRPEVLETRIESGRPEYGMTGVGPGKDSEGSNAIIAALEKNDDRPLWITAWGGPNTLAQALYTLRATRPAAEVDRLLAKLRVHAISDQDDSGPWIRENFPNLFYIVAPGGDYGAATWTGINTVVAGIDNTTIGNRWLAEHIQQGHGPLGAVYPDVSWGMEGDTPSWLALIPNGLNAPEHPDWGGWGGRYELYRPDIPVNEPRTFVAGAAIPPETRPIWTNAIDTYVPPVAGDYGRALRPGEKSFQGYRETLWRWRDDFQNDFAARMNWTTQPFAEANHPPVIARDTPDRIAVRSGEGFSLGVDAPDPDGDSLSYYWFPYLEAGTYKGTFKLDAAENAKSIHLTAPKVEAPATLHLIVRVADKGSPPLARYKRVIVTVTP